VERFRTSFIFLITATASLPSAGGAEWADPCFDHLSPGCFVTRSVRIPPEQTADVGNRLGTSLKRLSNTYLNLQGAPLQVNLLDVETTTEAQKLHRAILRMKSDPAFCLLRGTRVVEFCGNDVATAVKASYELGFVTKPGRIRYRITAELALVDTADYMSLNELFDTFLSAGLPNSAGPATLRIAELRRKFRFGHAITLRTTGPPGKAPNYGFEPVPTKTGEQLTSDGREYVFDVPPRRYGIPYVRLRAEITCSESGLTPTDRKNGRTLLSATPFWPVDDPSVAALAKTITANKSAPEAKVRALLEWLTPNTNIRFGGPVTGSRWGVARVLAQRYGHCWDFSDCFITLCRASGVACRQVGGWLYGSDGHIWAEVLLEGKGWQQVDPTGGGKMGCGIYHIPYFTTETGEMPILYVAMPRIEILRTEREP
jgi:hypothetical protein